MVLNGYLEYLGEYVIPVAGIVLVFAAWIREEIVGGVRLVRRFVKRMK